MHCNLWGFSTDWYQLGSVQFGSALFRTYSFPLQLVAIATKHFEKQHEQSALSWGKQPGIITIVSMDEIKGILFLILGLWLLEMCWSALSLNLRKTFKITIMTQSPCYNNNDQSCQLSRFRRVTHDFACFHSHSRHISNYSRKKIKKTRSWAKFVPFQTPRWRLWLAAPRS